MKTNREPLPMSRSHRNRPPTAIVFLTAVVAVALIAGGCASLPPPGTGTPSPTAGLPSEAGTGAAHGTLAVHFIDVGQGDATLVIHGNRTMLVDGGRIDAGETVASYLKSQGVGFVDVVVSTHPHSDHIGGLLTVLDRFPVGVVYDSGRPHTTQTYEKYLTVIDTKNIRYVVPERGDTIDLGPGVTVRVISPPPGGFPDGDLNENALVLKITHGDVGILLESDAGFEAENAMLASGYDLNSQVLKVAHHGSKHSSGKAFLKAVQPRISVIEVGSDRTYGHPAPATLARLEAAGSRVYRTDRDGNVVVTSDGKGVAVSTQRSAPA